MMFSCPKLLTLALTLVSCVGASPIDLRESAQNVIINAQSVIIGYRTVHPDQAAEYNRYGTLVYRGNVIGTQIGLGVYTTPIRGAWPGNPGNWHCVILAESDKFDAIPKAWVPRTHGGQLLWFNINLIDPYIRTLDNTWDPSRTLRMSIIDGAGNNDFQMVIPPALVGTNGAKGPLSITTHCSPTVTGIPEANVNYDQWRNVRGSRT